VPILYDTWVNLLAHAFLADGSADRIVGQLCGDFVRGADLSSYPDQVQAGIRCHRAVDTFTDAHELNLYARNLFEAPYRRYAGIVVDVLYDHFLAKDWRQYSDVPLTSYVQKVHTALDAHSEILPERLRQFAELIQSEDTLSRNIDREHIETTLWRLSQRRPHMAPLADVAAVMWAQEAPLKAAFDSFFPELLSYTRTYQTQQ